MSNVMQTMNNPQYYCLVLVISFMLCFAESLRAEQPGGQQDWRGVKRQAIDESKLHPDGLVPRPRVADRFETGEVNSGHRSRPLILELAVMEPAGPVSGTVLFLGGGNGDLWFGAGPVLQEIRDAGYRIVQRRWFPGYRNYNDPFSWSHYDGAELTLLLKSLSEEYGHKLCVVGSSGGAMELGEALGHHGARGFVSHAIFMAGPSFARFDMRVDGGAEYTEACQRVLATYAMDLKKIHAQRPSAAGDPEELCTSMLERYRNGAFAAGQAAVYRKLLDGLQKGDGRSVEVVQIGTIMRKGFDGVWPDTTVTFISGGLDLSSVGAVQLAKGITPSREPAIHIVPDRGHNLFQDGNGRSRMEPVSDLLLKSIRENYGDQKD